MGINKKSHGKKEKGTQSPVLKIFRDFMQKEPADPEKATLLKEKPKEKKKKSYSGFRKSEHRSYDSSSTDRYKRGKPHKYTVQGVREERKDGSTQGNIKQTWWSVGDKEKNTDDTCSCISCSVKKILASEYTCVACLLVLFSVSVVGAFFLVFKSSPIIEATKTEGDGVMKKIQLIKRQLNDGPNKKSWNVVQNLASLSGLYGTDVVGIEIKIHYPHNISYLSVKDPSKLVQLNRVSETNRQT